MIFDKYLKLIPSKMYLNETRIPDGNVDNCFASFFEEKVEKIVKSAVIDPMVYVI